MTACPAISADGPSGIAELVRAVDCATLQATSFTFGRLFGAHGTLLTALTFILTIYIGLLAIGILTGRASLKISMLTPRMMTLGLVLTFATSWAAYQSVIWNLAAGAPDEIARALTGTEGPATETFAGKIDALFLAVTEAASTGDATNASGTQDGGTQSIGANGNVSSAPPAPSSLFSPPDILWLSALLLMLGTAGVLIASRIVLAVLLAVGPVFIVLALFRSARGLFEGWVKSVVLFAVTPLLTVLIGGGALALIDPLAQSLMIPPAQPSMHAAVIFFLCSCIYVALMAITLKTATTLTAGWKLFGSDPALATPASMAEPIVDRSSSPIAIPVLAANDRATEIASVAAIRSSGATAQLGLGSAGTSLHATRLRGTAKIRNVHRRRALKARAAS